MHAPLAHAYYPFLIPLIINSLERVDTHAHIHAYQLPGKMNFKKPASGMYAWVKEPGRYEDTR